MNHTFDVVIIGGGQAGLVTGYYLNNHTRNYVILDANEQIGGAWQHYYESLKLFSPVRWAELPGLPFEADPDHYPTRNEVIDYLRDYARVHDLPVRSGVRVTSVERDESGFTLHTDGGDTYRAGAVVSASGPHNTPHMPALTGAEQFTGPRVHSYDYKNPEPYRDQHVVVIGARDSAMQIAYELAQVARVSMAVRHDLKFMPKYILGLSVFWWLHETGYDELPLGLFSHVEGTDRIVGKEPYQTALAAGNPQPKPMFTHFKENGVVWGDGTYEDVDAVIYATGFRPGLGYLRNLDALDGDGMPCHRAGVSETVEGLFYIGLFGQRSHASATLRGVDKDAKFIVRRVMDYLKHDAPLRERELAAGD